MLIVLTTTSSFEEAEKLAERIVNDKLAACVQIIPQMTSVYFWEGKIAKEPEHLLLIKTLSEKFGEVETFLLHNHPYTVPEIVALSVKNVSESYREWMTKYLL